MYNKNYSNARQSNEALYYIVYYKYLPYHHGMNVYLILVGSITA